MIGVDTNVLVRLLVDDDAKHRAAAKRVIARALESLDARSRRIVEERWLKVNDDGSVTTIEGLGTDAAPPTIALYSG